MNAPGRAAFRSSQLLFPSYQCYFQKAIGVCHLSEDLNQAFDLALDALLRDFDHLHILNGNSAFST